MFGRSLVMVEHCCLSAAQRYAPFEKRKETPKHQNIKNTNKLDQIELKNLFSDDFRPFKNG
jgi:hypothetical protein